LSDKEVLLRLQNQLEITPHVFFSVPSAYYPTFYADGAKLRILGHWMDALSTLSCIIKPYGQQDKFFKVQVHKTVLPDAIPHRREGKVLQGEWHAR